MSNEPISLPINAQLSLNNDIEVNNAVINGDTEIKNNSSVILYNLDNSLNILFKAWIPALTLLLIHL